MHHYGDICIIMGLHASLCICICICIFWFCGTIKHAECQVGRPIFLSHILSLCNRMVFHRPLWHRRPLDSPRLLRHFLYEYRRSGLQRLVINSPRFLRHFLYEYRRSGLQRLDIKSVHLEPAECTFWASFDPHRATAVPSIATIHLEPLCTGAKSTHRRY
jgi:hypothetical protein